MIKVFITNYHRYGDWYIGDIHCDDYLLLIKDYIFFPDKMPRLWHVLDFAIPGEEMYMLMNEEDILELKKIK